MADAVLYEGYVLYPYRASAPKNQVRWQWGVLMPPDAVEQDESERRGAGRPWSSTVSRAALRATVRFLQVQHRSVEDADGVTVERLDAGDTVYVPWDEAVEEETVLEVPLDEPATFDLTVCRRRARVEDGARWPAGAHPRTARPAGDDHGRATRCRRTPSRC